MNKCMERLYNGLIKENLLCINARNVSDIGGYNFSHQWSRYGTHNNSRISYV